MGSGAVPAQGGLPDRASSGSDCWDWERLAGVGKGWRMERGCVGFCYMEWLGSFVPCGKVTEGKTCKDIETPHRADGSYPGLDFIWD